MKLDKDQAIGFLQDRGESHKATDADEELPQKVDTDKQEDRDLLEKLGIDPMELAKQFMGDGGIPGFWGTSRRPALDLTSRSKERTR